MPRRSVDPPVHADCAEAVPRSTEVEVTATTGGLGHSVPPAPVRRPSRPCRSALHDVCRQEVQARYRSPATRAKMCAVKARTAPWSTR